MCFLTAWDPCISCISCYLLVGFDLKHKQNLFALCSLEIGVQTQEEAASLISKHCCLPLFLPTAILVVTSLPGKKGRFLTITHYLPEITSKPLFLKGKTLGCPNYPERYKIVLKIELDRVIAKGFCEHGALTYFFLYIRVDQDRLGFKDR